MGAVGGGEEDAGQGCARMYRQGCSTKMLASISHEMWRLKGILSGEVP